MPQPGRVKATPSSSLDENGQPKRRFVFDGLNRKARRRMAALARRKRKR
jgi:hypothetical protein